MATLDKLLFSLLDQFVKLFCLQERLLNKSKGTAAEPSLATNGIITNHSSLLRALPAPEITKVVENASASSSPTFALSHFSRQEKIEKTNNMVGGTEPCKHPDGENAKIVCNQMKSHQPINPFAKKSNNQEKVEEKRLRDMETCKDASKGNPNQVPSKVTSGGISNDGSKQKQSHGPVNPFAKASSNHEKSSLLDSIKKMKKADHGDEKVNNKKARTQMK